MTDATNCLSLLPAKRLMDHRIPQSEDVGDKWLPTTREQVRYLRIEANNPKLINNSMPFQSKLDFWKNLLTTGKDEL